MTSRRGFILALASGGSLQLQTPFAAYAQARETFRIPKFKIKDIAGHVSKQMLEHYSHIRMEAKRKALESIVQQNGAAATSVVTANPAIEGHLKTGHRAARPGPEVVVPRRRSPRQEVFGSRARF